MPLPSPNLDDRTFNQLLEEARRQIRQRCPEWTDLTPGDPGMMLLELFAYLTETLIYRLNRLPNKAYIEFLRLIGVRLQPPAAAAVTLQFKRSRESTAPLEIPRGTRVTVNRTTGSSAPPVFITDRTVVLNPDATQIEVTARHCEFIAAEAAGTGTGQPGQSLYLQHPPIIAHTPDGLDLIVGIEVGPEEQDPQMPTIRYADRRYRIWREVNYFADPGPDRFVYLADRMNGLILFAPAARLPQEDDGLSDAARPLAEVPAAGRDIRVWYRRGGGPEGNVASGTLTVLKDTLPGLEVTNTEPATGGQAAETLQNALIRGPQELHALNRAVTARDFELAARSSNRSVARARALTRATLWSYAAPGTVEILLVPYLSDSERLSGPGILELLLQRQTDLARNQVQQTIDERRPLGITCQVNWTRYKRVRVHARVVVRREEDPAVVRQQVLDRLHQSINPLPTPFTATGWPFGQALRASHVYEIALGESGVLWVDQVQLEVEEVPEKDVAALAADFFQPHTWYAGSGPRLFRSLDDGEGWETAGNFPEETIRLIRVHQSHPGLLAVVTLTADNNQARIHISDDCGESWHATVYTTEFDINDLAWSMRGETPLLWLATDAGLYELALAPDSSPVQRIVEPQNQRLGFYAVAVSRDPRGLVNLAVAAQSTGGVYLSSTSEDQPVRFRKTGLQGEDIRTLTIQYDGPRTFLWAGAASAGQEPGRGGFRWELRGTEDPPDGWHPFNKGWNGGSCRAFAFIGTKILAASYRNGVLILETAGQDPQWRTPDVRCGLPLRDPGRFYPIDGLATDPQGRLAMAGGSEGVYRSSDAGENYEQVSQCLFTDKVTLPPTWLFCSGEHTITAVREDEAEPPPGPGGPTP